MTQIICFHAAGQVWGDTGSINLHSNQQIMETLTLSTENNKKPATGKLMKGLVYGGPGIIELKEIPVPVIEKSTDALVKILKTTICGTDLGILHGKTPSCKPGTTLGH
jgi:hypothetical protein